MFCGAGVWFSALLQSLKQYNEEALSYEAFSVLSYTSTLRLYPKCSTALCRKSYRRRCCSTRHTTCAPILHMLRTGHWDHAQRTPAPIISIHPKEWLSHSATTSAVCNENEPWTAAAPGQHFCVHWWLLGASLPDIYKHPLSWRQTSRANLHLPIW